MHLKIIEKKKDYHLTIKKLLGSNNYFLGKLHIWSLTFQMCQFSP